MKEAFKPSVVKIALPVALIALSLLPSILIRNLVFGVLAMPYVWFLGNPPFPYHDKPWYVSPAGALATGCVWAVLLYVGISVGAHFRQKRKARPSAT
jgi:hypothetical protein